SGARFATVDITVTRSNAAIIAAGTPLIFQPGLRYLHSPDDYSESGPVQVLTGREYLGQEFAFIGPGELGPITVTAQAARAGAGYNLPQPDTILILDQPGATLNNAGASVVPTASTNRLVLRDAP